MKRLITTLAAAASLTPAFAGIQDIAGYQGIRIWEATAAAAQQVDFAAGDARLTSTLPGAALSLAGRDFGFFSGNENYDVYFSNADGTLNANGSYLTIDGNCDVPFTCFNITEAAIRVNGSDRLATGVARVVYGRPGSFVPGSAQLAVDGSFGTYTALGDTIGDYPNGRMSLTLSFDNVPAVPEPGTWALMAAGLALVARRRARA